MHWLEIKHMVYICTETNNVVSDMHSYIQSSVNRQCNNIQNLDQWVAETSILETSAIDIDETSGINPPE